MLSPFQFKDYRSYLKDVLAEKNAVQKKLSMRSLATRLGVSPSYLSRVLGGERHLSAPVASKLSHLFDFTPEEESHFLRLIARDQISASDSARLGLQRRLDTTRRAAQKRISSDSFVAIADWYYFAILSLTNTKGFKSEPAWIARRLGISSDEARTALHRLIRLGYLVLENGK